MTFAKLQELIDDAPGGVPGPPVHRAAVSWSRSPPPSVSSSSRVAVAVGGSLLLVWARPPACCSCCPWAAPTCPIVISLLNAFTGLTVAASGFVLGNVLLLVAGTLVGASGTILTRLMAAAMGRCVAGILFGAFRGGSTAGSTASSDRPVRSVAADDVAVLLGYAHKVVIVPGYGLAVAQASTRSASWPRRSRHAASRWLTPSTRSPAGCRGT